MNKKRCISQIVRSKRIEMGISQSGLAQMLGLKNGQYVSNIERDLCGLAPKYMLKVSKILKVPVLDLKNAYKADYDNHIDMVANKQIFDSQAMF